MDLCKIRAIDVEFSDNKTFKSSDGSALNDARLTAFICEKQLSQSQLELKCEKSLA